jgi:subtilisin family serine protease
MSDRVIAGIIIVSLTLAGFLYFTQINPVFSIKTPDPNTIPVGNPKVDKTLAWKATIQPYKKFRTVILLNNTTEAWLRENNIPYQRKGEVIPYVVAELNFSQIQEISQKPIEFIEEDREVYLIENSEIQLPNIRYRLQEAGYTEAQRQISLPIVHYNNITGEGVVVAILDTGVNYKLPDLDDNYLGGYDFAYDDLDPNDLEGHGTTVAALLAGEGDDQFQGIAPNASYYAVKVLDDSGAGKLSDVLDGLDWAVQHNVSIVSMSYGQPVYSPAEHTAIQTLYNKGVILVAAAGNEGYDKLIYPAGYPEVVSVGAVNRYGEVASWSNKGAFLAAPGVEITILTRFGTTTTGSGTSYATPIVSGVVALMKQVNPNLNSANVKDALANSTDPIKDPDNRVVHGMINASKAVVEAGNVQLKEPQAPGISIDLKYALPIAGLTLLVYLIRRGEYGA